MALRSKAEFLQHVQQCGDPDLVWDPDLFLPDPDPDLDNLYGI